MSKSKNSRKQAPSKRPKALPASSTPATGAANALAGAVADFPSVKNGSASAEPKLSAGVPSPRVTQAQGHPASATPAPTASDSVTVVGASSSYTPKAVGNRVDIGRLARQIISILIGVSGIIALLVSFDWALDQYKALTLGIIADTQSDKTLTNLSFTVKNRSKYFSLQNIRLGCALAEAQFPPVGANRGMLVVPTEGQVGLITAKSAATHIATLAPEGSVSLVCDASELAKVGDGPLGQTFAPMSAVKLVIVGEYTIPALGSWHRYLSSPMFTCGEGVPSGHACVEGQIIRTGNELRDKSTWLTTELRIECVGNRRCRNPYPIPDEANALGRPKSPDSDSGVSVPKADSAALPSVPASSAAGSPNGSMSGAGDAPHSGGSHRRTRTHPASTTKLAPQATTEACAPGANCSHDQRGGLSIGTVAGGPRT